MAKQNPIYLIRVYTAKMLIEHAMKHYGLNHSDFNMPSDLFNYELKLMPLRDFEALLCKIENLTQDPAYTAKLSQSTNLKQFGPFVQLIASSTNLGMAIKRVNTVHNAIQSGVQVNMLLSGSIAKWRFLSPRHFELPTSQIKAFTVEQAMSYMLIPQPHDILKVVFELTKYALFYGYPTLEFVADKVGMKPLTLQRRLQEQSISFTNIVHHSVCDEAIALMSTKFTMDDIARRVGYKNTASFSVAFKRMYGVTPQQYRQDYI